MGMKRVQNNKHGRWVRKLFGISGGEVLPTPQELRIARVTTKRMLRDFVEYPLSLYKDNPYYCPPLISDDLNALTPGKNASLEHCDLVCYLAYRGDRIVGRIAGIINHAANDRWGQNRARIGFLDFEDDEEVSEALISVVTDWAQGFGCDELAGPLGFTDMDREGVLVEGFSQVATFIEGYNYPYYAHHLERLGFEKDVDWYSFKIYPPRFVPERYRKGADIVRRRYGLEAFYVEDRKELVAKYANELFDLFNRTYSNLYGSSKLSDAEIQHLIDTFLPMINTDLIALVRRMADNKLVGFGVVMPSITKALQRSRGKLWPFGFIPILSALKRRHADVIDLMLIAVDPQYQAKGVNALIFELMIPTIHEYGVQYVESNLELEYNVHIQTQWNFFRKVHHKTHRCFVKPLTKAGEELARKRRAAREETADAEPPKWKQTKVTEEETGAEEIRLS